MNFLRTKTSPEPSQISWINSCLRRICCAAFGVWINTLLLPAQFLDQTAPLPPGVDWSLGMQDGAHRFVERIIAEAPAKRASSWHRDTSSPEAYEASVAPQRNRLRTLLGVVDPRVPVSYTHLTLPTIYSV